MIDIQNLTKSYSKKNFAVKDVSIKCNHGITGLIGLNGAGKSTILKCCTSYFYPESGKVFISDGNGTYFDTEKDSPMVKLNTGYVPENSFLPKSLKVHELLENTLENFNIPEDKRKIFFEKTVSACFLTDVLDKKISNLSKGYLQRTLLANAIIHQPENLILDEASSALDPSQIIQFRNLVKDYAKNHTVLISTHIMQEVSALCDKIYVIKEGKIIASGSENEILKATKTQKLEDAFLSLNGINAEGEFHE